MPFKNALVSVADKTGLVEFVLPLSRSGTRIVSTGGTAKLLREAGVSVIDVSEQTGFPEVMEGRVKTLHPRVHMALLARSHEASDLELLKQEGLEPFDLVIGNLYPFEQALSQQTDLIEYIDIGGPSLLRAAAKSFERITVICDPKDYSVVAETERTTGTIPLNQRQQLAAKVFAHVSAYDAMIADTLGAGPLADNSAAIAARPVFADFSIGGQLVQPLRYGENAQQRGLWYRRRGARSGWHQARILQGKELSYNNLLDLEAARTCVLEWSAPAAVAVKHNNPCGVAVAATTAEAVKKCLAADPTSVFGGIIALNRPLDADCARVLSEVFLECIVAPEVTSEAQVLLAKKKNLRVLVWPQMFEHQDWWRFQSVAGGFLLQDEDQVGEWQSTWNILGAQPSPSLQQDLLLAWKVCAHLKSNAIALAYKGQTIGLGMGQVNRVDAVSQSLARARQFHDQAFTQSTSEVVLASDAFFPFPDSIEMAAAAGVRWIIQPGGSVKDSEVFACAQKLNVNLVITGTRHFRH